MMRTNVKDSQLKWSLLVVLAAFLMLDGCTKKTATPAPPAPPPPAPTAALSANPETIEAGQASTLTWQTQNATEVLLDGQSVDPNGTMTVSPKASATYRLMVKGPGGAQEATSRVTVTQPLQQAMPQERDMFAQNIRHIFFDFDKYDIRPDQQPIVQADAQWLLQHPNLSFVIEGHCDERGSTEYNLALGDSRASEIKTALVRAGIASERIHTISYGKEKPFCTESGEECWQQNRGAYFVYAESGAPER